MLEAVHAAREAAKARTAWRIEGTLREFPRFDPLNLWFDYPVHRPDSTGALSDVEPEGEAPPWKRNLAKKRVRYGLRRDRQGRRRVPRRDGEDGAQPRQGARRLLDGRGRDRAEGGVVSGGKNPEGNASLPCGRKDAFPDFFPSVLFDAHRGFSRFSL